MTLVPAFTFLLALATFCDASVPDCKDLVQPFMPEDPKLIFGKWVYVMGAGDPQQYHKAMQSVQSSWIDLSLTLQSHVVTLRWGDRCFNRCILGEVNATTVGLTTMFRKNLAEHKGHILRTCSDCLLWTDTFRNGDVTGRFILLFTRSGEMEPKDVEVFQKQVGCLNFPANIHKYDGITGLCPDDKQTAE
ncbi:uncharacterized protein LOC133652308 isoform X2 [Entelurus aequoreus]|uniref:uncharacterized protein LOC133652308 isoform X2 n=1 Tax=Entelurus aequoreus TaxID=161455 RepID=UPI002B1DEE3D|nr:uncharacterized protein LOC133652308 isoform X2 [Entelurus aequoreus]